MDRGAQQNKGMPQMREDAPAQGIADQLIMRDLAHVGVKAPSWQECYQEAFPVR